MKTPASIGLFAPNRSDECLRAIDVLVQGCNEAGLAVAEVAALTSGAGPAELPEVLLCLGGDGTMLEAAKRAALTGAILGGINMGHLGFLTTCGREEIPMLVSALATGSYEIEERSMLQAERSNPLTGATGHTHYGLNELALMRAQTGKMIDVDVEVNGKLLNRYHADGILVATPTGSTAYSLSAGGPLAWPTAQVLNLTPICPHSFTNRAITLPDSMEIVLRPRERRGRAGERLIYSLDGRSTHDIALNETLTVRKAPMPLRLLALPGNDYAARLRAKLGW